MPLEIYGSTGLLVEAFAQGFLLASRTVITTTGASTYTVPANVRLLLIEAFGGGGSGGNAGLAAASQIIASSGGHGGIYSTGLMFTYPGATFTATVSAAVSGGNGGTTSFAMTNTANPMTITASGGAIGAAGSSGTTEIFTLAGLLAVTAEGDMNTSANSFESFGHRVSGTVGRGGMGSPGPNGGAPNCRLTHGNGAAGGKYGAGGAGAISINNAGTTTGGAGGQGLIIVWEFL